MHTKKPEKEKSKQGKKDLRNQNAEEGKMYFVYMMKCLLFSSGLSFCICFIFVLFCCYYCYLLIFWLRNNGPLFQAYPSTILSMNWHTPKHLGLLLCTGPPSSYFISSVPMLVLFTLCTIFLKLVITALRANLMLLQQL